MNKRINQRKEALTPVEKFHLSLMEMMDDFHKKLLSEKIKQGLKNRKNSFIKPQKNI